MKQKKVKDYYSAPAPSPVLRKLNLYSALRYPSLILFLLFSLFSCKDKTIVIPAEVLSQDSMVQVLVDLQIMEAMKITKDAKEGISQDSLLIQYILLLKKHNLTPELFEQSFDFYKEHPELLEDVYEMAISELHKRQANMGTLFKAMADSAAAAKGLTPQLPRHSRNPVVKEKSK